MTRTVHTSSTGSGPSVVDFMDLPRKPFTLEIEAHGVTVCFNDVAISKGAYSKDRVVEADLGAIESMVDSSGAIIADNETIDAIRHRLREIGVLAFDVRDGGYDCYSSHDDAGSKAVALREFSKRIVRAVRLVLDARKPATAKPRFIGVGPDVSVTDFMSMRDDGFMLEVAAQGVVVRFDNVAVSPGNPCAVTGYLGHVVPALDSGVDRDAIACIYDDLIEGSHSVISSTIEPEDYDPEDRYPIDWKGGQLPGSRTFAMRDFCHRVVAAIESATTSAIAA